jgi:hypothetical protein
MPAADGGAWIVFEAACSPVEVGAVVEHVRRRRPGREDAPPPRRFTECSPSVLELRASFVDWVEGVGGE